jgi:hypothetical protein
MMDPFVFLKSLRSLRSTSKISSQVSLNIQEWESRPNNTLISKFGNSRFSTPTIFGSTSKVERFCYYTFFRSNTLLLALKRVMENEGMELEIIINPKTNEDGQAIIQVCLFFVRLES